MYECKGKKFGVMIEVKLVMYEAVIVIEESYDGNLSLYHGSITIKQQFMQLNFLAGRLKQNVVGREIMAPCDGGVCSPSTMFKIFCSPSNMFKVLTDGDAGRMQGRERTWWVVDGDARKGLLLRETGREMKIVGGRHGKERG
ncbi:hypothetical protein MRB53_004823 [Persea americana]|uniref:Uncharacterized protein n=1 Tax=Persea americana TaxID=3435 RepID=A0ACC2MBM9_PERAE|nr:hypothetical protein MRB53_004823 [Persea americana]